MTAAEFVKEWLDPQPFVEAMTSGSTGAPKKIRLYKSDMIISAEATNSFFGLGKDSTFVCPMDFRYIGAKMMAVRAMCANGKLVEAEVSNRFTFDGNADLLAVVPSQVDHLLQEKEMLSRVRHLLIGGAKLSRKREEALMRAGVEAYVSYGMTETASHVALRRIGEPVYNALNGISFEKDERGCLVINMPERNVKKVVTNDIVELVSEKSFEWLGRYDNIINSGGLKIAPHTLESKIESVLDHFGLADNRFAIIGRDDEKWGEKVVCVIEGCSNEALAVSLLSAMKEKMSDDPRLCPKEVIFIPKFPITSNDKIDYSALRRENLK